MSSSIRSVPSASSPSAPTVLVTGAAGNLGGALARHLLPTLVHPTLESGLGTL